MFCFSFSLKQCYFCDSILGEMDINYEQVLSKLKERVTELVLLYERVKDENSELIDNIEKLKTEKNELDIKIKELKEKNDQMVLAGAIAGNSLVGNNGAKQKIDVLVRDIDRCIALLNK